jgi:iron-regulated transporter 1
MHTIETGEVNATTSRRRIYLTYFFAAWGDRMWEFAAIIFLLDIFPGTLLPSSLFGFFETVAGIASGAHVGHYIDANDRLKVVRTSILGQNLTIGLASLVFSLALADVGELSVRVKWVVVAVIIVAGMAAKVSSAMNKISIHKDWSVVLAAGDAAAQTHINAVMRRVDLVCSMVAPLLVGLLSMSVGSSRTCLFIAVWSLCSLGIETLLSSWVYRSVPQLQAKEAKAGGGGGDDEHRSWWTRQTDNWSAYRAHAAFAVSVPYCLLFMSVLSFHGVIVSYLRTLGVSDVWLAVGRAIAAVVAISATFAVPPLVKSRGLERTGLATIWAQIACLAPLVVAFLLVPRFEDQRATAFVVVLFATVCLSRFGLWGFDLAQTQLMQDLVAPEVAGAINGGQETLINVCWLMSFTFTIVFNDPRDFVYPVLLSFGAIFVASVLFTRYVQSAERERAAQEGAAAVGVTVREPVAAPVADATAAAAESPLYATDEPATEERATAATASRAMPPMPRYDSVDDMAVEAPRRPEATDDLSNAVVA